MRFQFFELRGNFFRVFIIEFKLLFYIIRLLVYISKIFKFMDELSFNYLKTYAPNKMYIRVKRAGKKLLFTSFCGFYQLIVVVFVYWFLFFVHWSFFFVHWSYFYDHYSYFFVHWYFLINPLNLLLFFNCSLYFSPLCFLFLFIDNLVTLFCL